MAFYLGLILGALGGVVVLALLYMVVSTDELVDLPDGPVFEDRQKSA